MAPRTNAGRPAPLPLEPFGAILRRLRLSAALTQEALAEAAGLSVKAVSDLERHPGRLPRLESVSLLADALHLDPDQRAALIAAARPREVASPVRAARGPSSRLLPRPLTPLVGRAFDVAAVEALVRGGGCQLLTLTGPGGVGKTRLAVAVASRLEEAFADGVVFVDLTPLGDPTLVVPAIARALGVDVDDRVPLGQRLAEYLEVRQLLLVLDNFEHVLVARGAVRDLIAACPRLIVLITSREALRVSGERVYAVAPLGVPEATAAPASLAYSPAVELFVQRARAAGAGLALDDPQLTAVAEICRRLDGLPLAIELAAAWAPYLSPPALLRRLESRLSLLVGGPHDAPARHETMRTAIAWSYDLLDPCHQRLFRALCAFEDGCAVEAAAALCDEDPIALLQALADLAAKSLVRLKPHSPDDPADGEPRVTLLATIREYGLERLAAEREADTLRARHAEFYLALAERAEPELTGPQQALWARRLERDHDNLRAALRWALESGQVAIASRLAGALWRLWSRRGYLTEGRRWLKEALGAAATDGSADRHRVKLLLGATVLAVDQGDYAEAARLSDQGLALARERAEARELAAALAARGLLERNRGRYDHARLAYEEALSLARAARDRAEEARALAGLGSLASFTGDLQGATELLEQGLVVFRELGDARGMANVLSDLLLRAQAAGDLDRAVALGEEALELYRALGDTGGMAAALFGLGILRCFQGDPAGAEPLLEESLALHLARGNQLDALEPLGGLAWVELNRGEYPRARALLEEGLATARRVDDAWALAMTVTLLGLAELADGNWRRARDLLEEGAELFQRIRNPLYLSWPLEGLAGVAVKAGRPDLAARLCGARDALQQQLGSSAPPAHPAGYELTLTRARAALGEAAFAALRASGRQQPLDGLLAEVASCPPAEAA